jgi:hypothetical protein
VDDAVSYNGSSYICKLASTGNLPTNTTYWDLLAQQGASGSGAGDVVGPASAVNDRLVAFDGTTGKLIKDSTFTAASFAKYADTTANFTGTLQNSGSNVLTASSIGSTVQAYDADLTTLGAGGSSARSFLGLAIGSDVQGYDAQLADIAGLTPTDNGVIVGNGTNFVVESGATLKTSLGLTIGTDVQAYDSNLTSFVNTFTLPTTDGTADQVLKTNGSGTLSFVTPSSGTSITISNDTSTATDVYPTFVSSTSGTASSLNTGNAKLLYRPSTGELKAEVPVAQNGIFVNAQTIDTSYTIGTGFNGMSAGPVTVDSGITVTVSSGSVWTVV